MTTDVKTSEALQTLQDFLSRLFQFDSADLDFGIYKILHYKKAEVEDFITRLLKEKVKEQLNILVSVETEKLNEEVQKLEKTTNISKYLEAVKKNDTGRMAIYEEDFEHEIDHYKSLKAQLEHQVSTANAEPLIYNHLTIFFSRYYDNGDFISKRRYGKSEKYVVPYNGEETYFHWANADQYYIKSSELFRKYSFRLPSPAGHCAVHFKLRETQAENGNTKSEDNKFFIISENPVEVTENEVNIFFEYRALESGEKEKKGKNQEELNTFALPIVTKALGTHTVLAELSKTINDKTRLAVELNRYTARNKYDFFIHKDLKGFLTRELDFYIKSELLKLDDLTVFDTVTHYEKIKLQFNIVKTFKSIATTIIDFISQVEDFQKKLWEKKKFVISTHYVITLDKLAAFTSAEFTDEILAEALKNENQLEEWRHLFGEEVLSKWKKLKPEDAKSEDGSYKKLPIDTVHFSDEFKWKVICKISEKKELDEIIEGLVIHSDNYHGLNLLNEKYYGKIDCIHIDPPYNTDTSGFLYKNDYKHSSWLSMMSNRIEVSQDLLSDKSSYICHIDENEYENLHIIFEKTGLPNAGTIIWDKRNPMNSTFGVATQHEYVIWRTKNTEPLSYKNGEIKSIIELTSSLIEKEGEVNEKVRKEYTAWLNSNPNLSGGEKAYRYIDDDGRIYQSVSLRAPEPRTDEKFLQPLIHPITGKPCPVPPNGFSRTPETLQSMIERGEILFGVDEKTQPRQKVYLTDETQRQITSVIQEGKKGKADTAALGLNFPYCHPVSLYQYLIGVAATAEQGTILDFFPGSGTTFHSVLELNRISGSRKCILVEQEDYVYSIIIPRIKKVAYSYDWKTGKPQSQNGLGIFFKYQRLEQYEEALENIAFNTQINTAQAQLKFNDYIPKYFLHFETSGSKTFLNLDAFKNPFKYSLKVFDNYNYTEQTVDVVETCNYLIGLHVNCYRKAEHQQREYLFVTGSDRQRKNIVVVWRDATNLDFAKDRDFIRQSLKDVNYDVLYVNNQCAVEGALMIEEVFKNKMN